MRTPVPKIMPTPKLRSWFSDDLRKHDQLMTLLDTYHKVQLSNNENYPDKLSWCLEHCQSKFRDLSHGNGILWYFESEQDATMFALRWT